MFKFNFCVLHISMSAILFTLIASSSLAQTPNVALSSDVSQEGRSIQKYWKSTGFTPSELIDYPDMDLTLRYLRASEAVEFIRPHFMLDNVKIYDFATENQRYDFSELDAKLDVLVENNLKLIFEIMGGPVDDRVDFADEKQLYAFKDLVRDLALHLQERYGKEVVESWYFESVNEPDIGYFWQEGFIRFINYYDACSQGLMEANPKLRFGGPGTATGGVSPFLKVLLEHCVYGKNYFTGERGTRIDFISIHKKNIPHAMIDDERENWGYVRKNFPSLKDVPVMNDEADPFSGWAVPVHWRVGAWYAAFIVQSVELHNRKIIGEDEYPLVIVSNDHGFLGSWLERTQLARFVNGDNFQRTRGELRMQEDRQARLFDEAQGVEEFFLIKQPTLTVMNMMNKYGELTYEVSGIDDENHPNVGAVVTKNESGDIIASVFNKPEIDVWKYHRVPMPEANEEHAAALAGQPASVSLTLSGLTEKQYHLRHILFDSTHSNAFATWQEMGEPEDLTLEQYHRLAAAMEPSLVEEKIIKPQNGSYSIEFDYPGSAVSFLFLDNPTSVLPGISNLESKTYKGQSGTKVVMLNWEIDAENDLLSYEIQARKSGSRRWKTVNPTEVYALGWAHVIPNNESYEYRVRALSFWGKKGKFSSVLKAD